MLEYWIFSMPVDKVAMFLILEWVPCFSDHITKYIHHINRSEHMIDII